MKNNERAFPSPFVVHPLALGVYLSILIAPKTQREPVFDSTIQTFNLSTI
jgi:hypothetical protein